MTEIAHRVCERCYPSHVENCATCFGWGLTREQGDHITGSCLEAVQASCDWRQCQECGGTPIGRYRDNPRYPEGK